MAEFVNSLATLTPNPHRPLVGDLDNVILECRDTIREVESVISAGERGADNVRSALYVVRLKLKDHLPMLFEDVIQGIDELIGPDE